MTRAPVASVERLLLRAQFPPHIQQAVLALRDHIAACGPVRWRATGPRPIWTVSASVRGHVICLIRWRPSETHIHVVVRDTAPGDGRLARIAYVLGPSRAAVLVDSVDAAAALFLRLTTAYALAIRPPTPNGLVV